MKDTLVKVSIVLWILYGFSCLTSSLTTDEIITYWIIQGDLWETIRKALTYQGQSPLFFLIEFFIAKLVGTSEIALRIISFCFLLLSSAFLYKTALILFSKETALLTVLLFVSAGEYLSLSTIARPSSLAMMFITISTYYLICWLKDGQLTTLLSYLLSGSLILYAYPIFIGVIGAQLIFAFFHPGTKSIKQLRPLIAVQVLIGLLSLPVFYQLLFLISDNPGFVETGKTSLTAAFQEAIDPITIVIIILCIFFAGVYRWTPKKIWKALNSDCVWPLIIWCAAPNVLIYILSLFTNQPVFQSRYLVWSLPAYSLLIAQLINSSFKAKPLIVVILCMQAAFLYNDLQFSPRVREDWRTAAKIVEYKKTSGPDTAVFIHPTLIESLSASWISSNERKSYLSAPLQYYGNALSPVVLPWYLHRQEDQDYIMREILPVCRTYQDLVIVYRGKNNCGYLRNFFKKQGYDSSECQQLQGVGIVEFNKKEG